MKSIIFTAAGLAALAAMMTPANAYQLQARVYVFQGADIASAEAVAHGTTRPLPGDGQWSVLTAPAAIQFGGETLAIHGSDFAWKSSPSRPSKFNLVSSPEASIAPDGSAKVVIGETTQYMEKQPDGSFRLREYAAGSPEAAHCDLDLSVRPADSGQRLSVTCAPEIVAVKARERIPGVDLDVGKPVLAEFKDNLTFDAQSGEWSCLYNRAPDGSAYGLLVLIKITAGTPPSAVTALSAPATAQVDEVVDVTKEGKPPLLPQSGHPVYYVPLPAGYADMGNLNPGELTPPTTAIDRAFAATLFANGYRLASRQFPPSIVLVIRWGYLDPGAFPSPTTFFGRLVGSPQAAFAQQVMKILVGGYQMPPTSDPTGAELAAAEATSRYYIMISAFDFADWARHHTTWLWDARLSVAANGISLRDALPTLIAAAGPVLGRDTSKPSFVDVPVVDGSNLGRAQVDIAQITIDSTGYRNPTPELGHLPQPTNSEDGNAGFGHPAQIYPQPPQN